MSLIVARTGAQALRAYTEKLARLSIGSNVNIHGAYVESRVTALEVKVGALEKRSDEHEREDERLHRYMTHMMEDLQAKLAILERAATRFESDLTHRSINENGTQDSLKDIFERLRALERMAWIAIGSTTAFGSVVVYFGKTISNMLLK